MRIVAIAYKHTAQALLALGVEPMPVDSPRKALNELTRLAVNKNNVILISSTIAEKMQKEIAAIEEKYKDSVIVVVPDMHGGIDMDIDKMIANVVGVKI